MQLTLVQYLNFDRDDKCLKCPHNNFKYPMGDIAERKSARITQLAWHFEFGFPAVMRLAALS